MSSTRSSDTSGGIILIIKIPAGEAPKWVRKAWLGLELPCDPFSGLPDSGQECGVITNSVVPRRDGYSVLQKEAIAILERKRPKAAKWWKDHGFPKTGEYFSFDTDEAEIIRGVTPKIIVVVHDAD